MLALIRTPAGATTGALFFIICVRLVVIDLERRFSDLFSSSRVFTSKKVPSTCKWL